MICTFIITTIAFVDFPANHNSTEGFMLVVLDIGFQFPKLFAGHTRGLELQFFLKIKIF